MMCRAHPTSSCHTRPRGVTAIELIVVVGIITILASIVLPIITAFRGKAQKTQCASNLRQLHQALIMYSNDNASRYELYPTYLGNLMMSVSGSPGNTDYVNDPRVFICPSDPTKATVNAYGVTSLKPYYSATVPSDNKASWAERLVNGMGQVNCSYLYEFSGRVCTTFTVDPTPGSNDGGTDDNFDSFVSTLLCEPANPFWYPNFVDTIQQDDNGNPYIEAGVDRTYDGVSTAGTITWQDAKFFQLQWGDQYRSGQWDAVSLGLAPPPPGMIDPIDYYFDVGIDPSFDFDLICISYPRTWMPILRCFWHQTPAHVDDEGYEEVQNITLDGNIYNSSPYWERTCYKYGNKTDGYIPSPPIINSPLTATATVGVPFNYTVTALNNPTSITVSGLPSGLVFDGVSTISGTPTSAGANLQITLDAGNANGDDVELLTLTINGP